MLHTLVLVYVEEKSPSIEKSCSFHNGNYLECVKNDETNILHLLLDLTNPSPGIGWENQERMSLLERNPTDTVFALALIHHLAISNNLPLKKIADFLNKICSSLIIEFIPKSNS